jgi:hypothetical protein
MLSLLLLGCAGDPVSVTVLEGFGYRWNLFNHRVSFVEGLLDDTSAQIAVVGGTSTTGVEPELADTCDADSCAEFPFEDASAVTTRWGRLTAPGIGAGVADVTFDVGAAGATTTVDVPVDSPDEAVTAVLRGLVVDTTAPQESCYNPAYGWHPRRIAVSLGAPVAGDGVVSVPVTATFAAGASLEEERACIDAVYADAVVQMTVRVAVVTGKVTATEQSLDQSMAYTYGTSTSPGEQPDPDPATRPLSGDPAAAVYAWKALDFQFHVDDPDDRGAYLRSIVFAADADAGTASGHATNYSPGTQLSAFDYAFTGTVVALGAPDATVERGVLEAEELDAELDASEAPVVTTLALE